MDGSEKGDGRPMAAERATRYDETAIGQADVPPFAAALDAHQGMIDAVAEELAVLRNVLAPLTQDAEVDPVPSLGSNPEPPVSELTRRVRWMTEQLVATRDNLRAARAYLDL